jgi:hypothetical protein
MFAFISNFLVKPTQSFLVKAPGTLAFGGTAAGGFAEQPRAISMEQVTMAALVILSGLTLANSILGA